MITLPLRPPRQLPRTEVTTALANLRALLIVLAAALFSVAAQAQDYPARPEGPVYDGAQILSPETEASLDARLREYNKATGRALVVATVPTIDGMPIEQYATGLFADWGIGGAQRDMGLLLLIAPNDRELRIEVGYGLHPYFGGIMSGRVINDVIVPQFKQDNYDGGVTAGVDAIIQHLDRSPAEAAAIAEAEEAARKQESSEGGFPLGTVIWFAFIFLFFILPMIRGGGRRKRYRSRGPWGDTARDIVLWEVGKAIARGLDDDDRGGGGWGGGGFGGGGFGGGGGGGFGGFGGGMSGGGGASGSW